MGLSAPSQGCGQEEKEREGGEEGNLKCPRPQEESFYNVLHELL